LRKRLAIVAATVAVLSLIAGAFFLAPAKADDLVNTHVGFREIDVYKNGSPSAGEISLQVYASQFDKDGDGDTAADSQRAVGKVFKKRNAYKVQINTVRLQRSTPTGWETLKSSGSINSGVTRQSIVAYTAPPTPFDCDGSDIFRVQIIGLVRWNRADGQLNSFNRVSHRWINVPNGSLCEALEV
jgi:hypothetical protein